MDEGESLRGNKHEKNKVLKVDECSRNKSHLTYSHENEGKTLVPSGGMTY